MFKILGKRRKAFINYGRLVFLNMIIHLITMWIDFFFHRRKEGMYKINIKQSQSQFFGLSGKKLRLNV